MPWQTEPETTSWIEQELISVSSPRAAAQVFLAAYALFALFTQMSIPVINDAVALLIPSKHVMFLGPLADITTDPGKVDIDALAGSSLWYYERIPAFFCMAITALVIVVALAWAVTTRRIWVMLLTAVVFAVPVAAVAWLSSRLWLGSSFAYPVPLTFLTIVGELEAIMGMAFLSIVKGAQAISTQAYRRLGVIISVDLLLILLGTYLVKDLALFTSGGYAPLPVLPIQDTIQYSFQYTFDLLGLLGSLWPFATVGMLALAMLGSDLSAPLWWVALVIGGLLTVLMVATLMVCTVGVLSSWPYNGPLIYDPFLPLPWSNAMGYSPWSAEVIEVGMLLATLLAVAALRSLYVTLTAHPMNRRAEQST